MNDEVGTIKRERRNRYMQRRYSASQKVQRLPGEEAEFVNTDFVKKNAE